MDNQKETVNGLDVSRKELINAIKIVLPGTSKEVLGVDCIVFDSNWLRTFNDHLSFYYRIETGASGVVRAKDLYKVLTKMKGEIIRIVADTHSIALTDSRTTLLLTQLREDEVEMLKTKIASLEINQLNWQPLPKGFAEGLPFCLFKEGRDSTLGKLYGVVFVGRNIIATDNYRISRYQMESSISDEPFRLSTTDLSKLNKDFEYVAIKGDWFHLKSKDNLIVSLRTMSTEDYPIDKVMEVFDEMGSGDDSEIYKFPEDLEKSIELAMILAGIGEGELNFSTQISLWREGGYLLLKGRNNVGEVVDRIPWSEGKLPEGIGIEISPLFLKQVLAITRCFKLSPTQKSVIFVAPNFSHLILARISEISGASDLRSMPISGQRLSPSSEASVNITT